jgi:hypothetical protein
MPFMINSFITSPERGSTLRNQSIEIVGGTTAMFRSEGGSEPQRATVTSVKVIIGEETYAFRSGSWSCRTNITKDMVSELGILEIRVFGIAKYGGQEGADTTKSYDAFRFPVQILGIKNFVINTPFNNKFFNNSIDVKGTVNFFTIGQQNSEAIKRVEVKLGDRSNYIRAELSNADSEWKVEGQRIAQSDQVTDLIITAKATVEDKTAIQKCVVKVAPNAKPEFDYAGWNRVMPRCRAENPAPGLETRTADALWFLARQWQLGEFQGEDAASPLAVQLKYSTQPLEQVKLGNRSEWITDTPLEMQVEQEFLELDWRTRVKAGHYFEQCLDALCMGSLGPNASPQQIAARKVWTQKVIKVYRQWYPLELPTGEQWTALDQATQRFLQFMVGRVIDGGLLIQALDFSSNTRHRIRRLQSVDPRDTLAGRLIDWCRGLGIRPEPGKAGAWCNPQLHYRFEVNPPESTEPRTFQIRLDQWWERSLQDLDRGLIPARLSAEFVRQRLILGEEAVLTPDQAGVQWRITDRVRAFIIRLDDGVLNIDRVQGTHLIASNYRSGSLDWDSFNVLGTPQGRWANHSPITTRPAPIRIGDMSPRCWAFENGSFNLGQIEVGKTDLAKLSLIQFVYGYSDDWFSVPLSVEMGHLVRIDELTVSTVFGEERLPVPSARKFRGNPQQRWELFTLSPAVSAEQPGAAKLDQAGVSNILLIPTVAHFRQESEPLEEIRFLQDEGANLFWAIEHTVGNGLGHPIEGFDAQRERLERDRQAEIQRLETRLAWIEGRLANPRLRDAERAALETESDVKRTRLTLLREGAKPSGETVPRYRLATTVCENWIPFMRRKSGEAATASKIYRAQMLRNTEDEDPSSIPAMSQLLDLADDPLWWLEDGAIPRSGLRVQLTAQLVCGADGQRHLWWGRKVLTGRGEGNSGLRFDGLAP